MILLNISLFADKVNPLQEYLKSLDKPVNWIYPWYYLVIGEFSTDYQGRIKELKLPQSKNSGGLDILSRQVLNSYQVSSKMTWDLTYKTFEEFPVQQKWFATGEGLAHIKYLIDQCLVERTVVDGMYLYKCVSV